MDNEQQAEMHPAMVTAEKLRSDLGTTWAESCRHNTVDFLNAEHISVMADKNLANVRDLLAKIKGHEAEVKELKAEVKKLGLDQSTGDYWQCAICGQMLEHGVCPEGCPQPRRFIAWQKSEKAQILDEARLLRKLLVETFEAGTFTLSPEVLELGVKVAVIKKRLEVDDGKVEVKEPHSVAEMQQAEIEKICGELKKKEDRRAPRRPQPNGRQWWDVTSADGTVVFGRHDSESEALRDSGSWDQRSTVIRHVVAVPTLDRPLEFDGGRDSRESQLDTAGTDQTGQVDALLMESRELRADMLKMLASAASIEKLLKLAGDQPSE